MQTIHSLLELISGYIFQTCKFYGNFIGSILKVLFSCSSCSVIIPPSFLYLTLQSFSPNSHHILLHVNSSVTLPTLYLLFVCLLLPCSRTFVFCSPFLLAFLLLSDDIEQNPAPTNFTVCCLNIRSILHPLHSAALSDLIDAHTTDLLLN